MNTIGTISYATESGLGIITKDFIENGLIDRILILEHEKFDNHFEWYPGAKKITRNVKPELKEEFSLLVDFISQVDVLVLIESPWNPYVIPLCRQLKKKVVLMPNHEWTPWPLDVDLILCPSELEKQLYLKLQNVAPVEYINIPVNSKVKWKKRESPNKFLHNSGRGSSNDRNGTNLLISSLPYISKSIDLTIRGQGVLNDIAPQHNVNLSLVNNTVDFESLYDGFDVFIFVERFCGSSLPLQEAFASGLAIIAGNRFPINTWLPTDALVNTSGHEMLNFIGIPFEAALYNPDDLAARIDEISSKDLTNLSLLGKEWGERNSWQSLKNKYQELLRGL